MPPRHVPRTDGLQRRPRLSPRQRQVLALLAQGLGNEDIAQQLCVSKHTLQHHITAIYTKLGGLSRAEAIVYAIRHGYAGLGQGPSV